MFKVYNYPMMQVQKSVNLIGYNCGVGAKKQQCSDSPLFLKERGLSEHLRNAPWLDFADSSAIKDESGEQDIIRYHCNHIYNQVKETIGQRKFPIVFGGDHSSAMGTWSAVADSIGKLGLIWVDAHMDAHTFATSHSGKIHGMPLSYLLGESEIVGARKRYVAPENICLIGIRSYEPEERAFLDGLGVKIFYMEDIRRDGITSVFERALTIVKNGTNGFGVSIDVDVFDPSVAPGTGCLVKNGMFVQEFLPEFAKVKQDSMFKALEIAEFNADLDIDDKTFDLIVSILS